MKPTTQTILHDPENGRHGNCFSAVLASLLHLPIETIPVFSDRENWRKDVNAFLRPYGLAYMSVINFHQYCLENGITGCHHEISGVTERYTDVLHSCVAADGHLIFDPHPSRAGVISGEEDGVFIAMQPWRLTERKHARPDVVPGTMRCARCQFRLVRNTVQTGQITEGANTTEPCPNGCGPLWPVTWREEVNDLRQMTEAFMDRMLTAQRKAHLLRKSLAALVGAESPEELKQMQAVLQNLPMDEAARASTLGAVQALLQTTNGSSQVLESSWDGDRP